MVNITVIVLSPLGNYCASVREMLSTWKELGLYITIILLLESYRTIDLPIYRPGFSFT